MELFFFNFQIKYLQKYLETPLNPFLVFRLHFIFIRDIARFLHVNVKTTYRRLYNICFLLYCYIKSELFIKAAVKLWASKTNRETYQLNFKTWLSLIFMIPSSSLIITVDVDRMIRQILLSILF